MEDAVFLRSALLGDDKGGDETISLFVEPRESHANGLVSFLVGPVGAEWWVGWVVSGGAIGGAPQGTDGRTPDSPCSDGFAGRGGGGGGVFSGVLWLVNHLERPRNRTLFRNTIQAIGILEVYIIERSGRQTPRGKKGRIWFLRIVLIRRAIPNSLCLWHWGSINGYFRALRGMPFGQ